MHFSKNLNLAIPTTIASILLPLGAPSHRALAAQPNQTEAQQIDEFRGKTVTIRQRLSGTGPFGSALHNHPSWGIFTITNGIVVEIKQSTLVLNALFGNAKWWDHEVIASRTCKKTDSSWESKRECVEGKGDTINLPDNSDFREYVYEFKWLESGSTKFWKTEITGKNNEK
jgi:hypothetical protein